MEDGHSLVPSLPVLAAFFYFFLVAHLTCVWPRLMWTHPCMQEPKVVSKTSVCVHVCIDFNSISRPLISTAVYSSCMTAHFTSTLCVWLRPEAYFYAVFFPPLFFRLVQDCDNCVLRYDCHRVHRRSTVAKCIRCDTDGGLQLQLTGCFNAAETRGFIPGPMERWCHIQKQAYFFVYLISSQWFLVKC